MRPTVVLIAIALALGATAATSGCGARSRGDRKDGASSPHADGAPAADGPAAPRFVVRILAKTIEIPRDYDALLAQVTAPASAPAQFALDERDIARYRVDPAPSRRVELELTASAAQQLLPAFRLVGERHPFVVLLDGQLLYAGVTYFLMGAAAVPTPVLGVDPFGGSPPKPRAIRIGATMGAWGGGGGSADPAKIDRPELRKLFEARGALGSL